MRKISFILFTSFVLSCTSFAQSRMEAGIFLDALSISQTGTTNIGLGARFGYRIHPAIMLEAELAYDYGLNFHEAYVDLTNGDIVAIENTSIGVTHGLIGPMVEPSRGHFRPFATLKAGFMDFRLSGSLLPYSGVVSSVLGLRTSNLNAALYPAGESRRAWDPSDYGLKRGTRCTLIAVRTTTSASHLVRFLGSDCG